MSFTPFNPWISDRHEEVHCGHRLFVNLIVVFVFHTYPFTTKDTKKDANASFYLRLTGCFDAIALLNGIGVIFL